MYSVNIGRTPIEYYNGYLYLSCYDYNGISPNMDYEKYNCERYDIKEFCLEHQKLIKERVFFKVDRTLERIKEGYYEKV